MVEQFLESGLIKDLKVLRAIGGKERFAMLAKFSTMEDAMVYVDKFNQSGISLKYQDVQLDTAFEFFEILDDDDIEGIFSILSKLK